MQHLLVDRAVAPSVLLHRYTGQNHPIDDDDKGHLTPLPEAGIKGVYKSGKDNHQRKRKVRPYGEW